MRIEVQETEAEGTGIPIVYPEPACRDCPDVIPPPDPRAGRGRGRP